MGIEEKIYRFADENNIVAGICDTGALRYENAEKAVDIPFSKYNLDQRITPVLLMPSAKSIIVIGAGYNKKLDFEPDNEKRGVISVHALGVDYHKIIRKILENLRDYLHKFTDFDSKIYIDTGPLMERELAVKAGLGSRCRNMNIVNPTLGSFFNIGYMLTTLLLEPSKAQEEDHCEDCNVCIRACPSGALTDTGFDYRKCVSYLTQKKGGLTAAEKKSIGANLYGCDVCQRVCKHNINTYIGSITKINAARPRLNDILTLDGNGFADKYSETAMSWIGLKTLQRNARIAIENIGD